MGKPSPKNKIKTILRRLILALIGIAIGLNVYSSNSKNLTRSSMPMPFGVGVAVVMSESMTPELNVNDLVVVKATDDYSVGDIVVYQSKNELIIHRIVQMNGSTVITKGDANNVADDAIDISSIKGVLVIDVPVIGAFVKALQSPVGIIVMIALAIWLMESSFRRQRDNDDAQIQKIKDEINRLKNEKEE